MGNSVYGLLSLWQCKRKALMQMHEHDEKLHVLIAGDSRDYPAIRTLVQQLPQDGYGQIFIEVAVERQVQDFAHPSGMTLHWLVAERNFQRQNHPAFRGMMLCSAISGWFSEWLIKDFDHEGKFVVWIGGALNPRVAILCDDLSREYGQQILQSNYPYPVHREK